MSAPERIWAGRVDGYGQWWEGPDIVGQTPYTRADIADARVPELERIAMAAEELAPAFQCLLEYLEGLIEDGCPQCGGDCAGANPPLAYCPMKEMNNDLAKYNAALAKLREATE